MVSVRQGWGDRDAGNRKRHEKAQECRMPKLQQQLSPTPDAILIPLEAPGLGEANRIALADKRGPYCFFEMGISVEGPVAPKGNVLH